MQRDGESRLSHPVYSFLLQALGGIRPDATMKRVRATLLLVLAASALAACRQLRQDNVTGERPSLPEGCLHTRLNAMTGQLRSFSARSCTALLFAALHAVYARRECVSHSGVDFQQWCEGMVPHRCWYGAHARCYLIEPPACSRAGSGVVLSDGTALFEGADRESWCRANLPAYNRSEPLPVGFAPVPSYDVAQRSVAGAPAPAYGSAGAARAARSAPQPLMVPGPHRRARYVCSDAFFFCFARDRCRAQSCSASPCAQKLSKSLPLLC